MNKNNKFLNKQTNMFGKICVSCEICRAVCPVNAISMEYIGGQFIPKIDKNKCIQCGLCLKVCPGIDIEKIDYKDDESFKKAVTGNYLETYNAYSKNTTILDNSTSGGVITTLALNLLKDKKVKGAFVLPFKTFGENPARLQNQNISQLPYITLSRFCKKRNIQII